MNKTSDDNKSDFLDEVDNKERQMLYARNEEKRSEWRGFGTFGMVGWSVAVPTVLGAVLGVWLDKEYPQTFSWTLTLLIAGLFVGCALAWQWIDKENKSMHEHKNKKDE
ncbi:AtpZ/AtpI family protein [Maribacter sp. BPC-D8]|uniref:AtpZ/AtpI family protein n=1 Tax=Flavobacteriaceae TaxID=49546 RepID=UPI0013FD9772|nr:MULTISPECIES: AtpZ/AtpI family protein [Flavobacteriaceae]WRI31456.1 AtpZ/AtpI family protein [Maribacter sp. BPC-D8]